MWLQSLVREEPGADDIKIIWNNMSENTLLYGENYKPADVKSLKNPNQGKSHIYENHCRTCAMVQWGKWAYSQA